MSPWLVAAALLVAGLSPILAGGAHGAGGTTPPPACVRDRVFVAYAAVNQSYGEVLVSALNRGPTCRIEGAPRVALQDARHHTLASTEVHHSTEVFAWAPPRGVTLAHGRTATFGVLWIATAAGRACPRARWLAVSLPRGVGNIQGTLATDLPYCGPRVWVTALSESGPTRPLTPP